MDCRVCVLMGASICDNSADSTGTYVPFQLLKWSND